MSVPKSYIGGGRYYLVIKGVENMAKELSDVILEYIDRMKANIKGYFKKPDMTPENTSALIGKYFNKLLYLENLTYSATHLAKDKVTHPLGNHITHTLRLDRREKEYYGFKIVISVPDGYQPNGNRIRYIGIGYFGFPNMKNIPTGGKIVKLYNRLRKCTDICNTHLLKPNYELTISKGKARIGEIDDVPGTYAEIIELEIEKANLNTYKRICKIAAKEIKGNYKWKERIAHRTEYIAIKILESQQQSSFA